MFQKPLIKLTESLWFNDDSRIAFYLMLQHNKWWCGASMCPCCWKCTLHSPQPNTQFDCIAFPGGLRLPVVMTFWWLHSNNKKIHFVCLLKDMVSWGLTQVHAWHQHEATLKSYKSPLLSRLAALQEHVGSVKAGKSSPLTVAAAFHLVMRLMINSWILIYQMRPNKDIFFMRVKYE